MQPCIPKLPPCNHWASQLSGGAGEVRPGVGENRTQKNTRNHNHHMGNHTELTGSRRGVGGEGEGVLPAGQLEVIRNPHNENTSNESQDSLGAAAVLLVKMNGSRQPVSWRSAGGRCRKGDSTLRQVISRSSSARWRRKHVLIANAQCKAGRGTPPCARSPAGRRLQEGS